MASSRNSGTPGLGPRCLTSSSMERCRQTGEEDSCSETEGTVGQAVDMFTLRSRLALSCQSQTTSVQVLRGTEVLTASLSEAGGPSLTVTPSVCQGLKPNGLALEGLISLHPGCTKRNLGSGQPQPSLHSGLPDCPNLKGSTQLLICRAREPTNILCSHTPSSSLQLLLLWNPDNS